MFILFNLLRHAFEMFYCWDFENFLIRVHKYPLGNSFLLAWKANKKDCTVQIRELTVELTVRAFNSATEKFPQSHTESSAALLPEIEVC